MAHETVAAALSAAITERNWTGTQLAALLNMSTEYVRALVRGQYIPGARTCARLEDALGLPAGKLTALAAAERIRKKPRRRKRKTRRKKPGRAMTLPDVPGCALARQDALRCTTCAREMPAGCQGKCDPAVGSFSHCKLRLGCTACAGANPKQEDDMPERGVMHRTERSVWLNPERYDELIMAERALARIAKWPVGSWLIRASDGEFHAGLPRGERPYGVWVGKTPLEALNKVEEL